MTSDPRSCILIPARFASSRYPGKPLVPLLGKPMILWVAELAARAVGQAHVHVATDDEQIRDTVEGAGFSALMTGSGALTGTDRLAEAARQIDYDIYINLQGDEPLVDPEDIRRCIALKSQHPDCIINGFTWLGEDEDPSSVNIPKVITNEAGFMVYMSRQAVPGFKDPAEAPRRYKKQVCIYGFSRAELDAFADFGRKGALERHEDIEILRFLELDRRVMMYECSPGSLAVDVEEDVAAVEAEMRRRGLG
ncbi:3-deoxy-manno-octulosonate cytidylyltransferase [Wenzhouxiangella marina]|nr:3-deoxy-manno-octulosonate cytidylyltransferase [Wenzhouxiangella marina]MBB6086098.1 3-deoxy-manno-octulosonate cytidylyltransferase (CMP-KDO synthetase) [Wenzhouxiangella marina]